MKQVSTSSPFLQPLTFNRFYRVMLIPGLMLFVLTGYYSLVGPQPPDASDPGYPLLTRIAGALVIGPTSVILGWFVSRRVKENPIGPILMHWGCATNAELGVSNLPAFWGALSLYYLMIINLPSINLLLAFFPTGRGVTPLWNRVMIIVTLVYMGLGFLANLTVPDAYGTTSPSPLAITGLAPIYFRLITVYSIFLSLSVILAVALTIYRYRISRESVRKQMRWLLVMAGYYLLAFGGGTFYAAYIPEITGVTWLINSAINIVAFTLPSITISIALLRYRLWDIDLIIRRTLVYGLLTGTLALLYFGGVTLLQWLFSGFSGQQSSASIVVSTLAIAALASPLRRGIQRFIDRRFYRSQYDAAQTLAEFSAVARSEVEQSVLTAKLLSVVSKTIQPQNLGLWLGPIRGSTLLNAGRSQNHEG